MKISKLYLLGMATLISAALTGCATDSVQQQNQTAAGAVTGAVIGGVLGNVIGDDTNHTLTGAAIGGAVGAAVGHGWEKKKAEMSQ